MSKLKQIPLALLMAAGLMVAGAAGSVALKPTHMTADDKPAMNLEEVVPREFGEWRADDQVAVITPDPTVTAKLGTLYSETLARTFVNRKGERVMLSIAYGRNQNSQSTAAHRPEFCYSAQGFNIRSTGRANVKLATHEVTVARLVADQDGRIEPISYWVTLDDQVVLPGVERKLMQLQYGLRGLIADGMLVRVSSFSASKTSPDYSLHDRFLADMEAAISPSNKSRFFGS